MKHFAPYVTAGILAPLLQLIILTGLAPSAHADEDRCADVLINSVYEQDNTKSVAQNLADWIKTESFTQTVNNRADNFGVMLPLPNGLNLGFNASNKSGRINEMRALVDSGSLSQLSERQAEYVFSQFVTPDKVEAWKECMLASGTRGIVDSDHSMTADGQIITVEYQYIPISTLDPRPKMTADLLVIGGKVIGTTELQSGKELDSTLYLVNIQRDSDSGVVVHMQTSRGHVGTHIPAINQVSDRPAADFLLISEIPIKEGDFEALRGFRAQWAEKLSASGDVDNPMAVAHLYARRVSNRWRALELSREYQAKSASAANEQAQAEIDYAYNRSILHAYYPSIINNPVHDSEKQYLEMSKTASFRAQSPWN